MTELLNIGAVVLGIFFSYFVTDYVLTLFYHIQFTSKDKYIDLYDELDTSYHSIRSSKFLAETTKLLMNT